MNVTERCNIRCIHCYRDSYGRNADPSLEALDGILAQFKELTRSYHERGWHVLTLGGGEPTVRTDLEDLIALAVRRGFKVRLVTNAMLVDEKRARALKRAGLSAVQVSLDGATASTHDRIRGPGSWHGAMRGIAAFKRARLFTVLSYVLLPGLNMEEAPLLLDLARALKVAGVKFARPVKEGQAVINEVSVEADYWTAFKRIVDRAQAIRYRRLLFFFDPLAHLLRVEETARTSGIWGLATDLCQCNNTELIEVDGPTGDVTYCRIRARLGNLRQERLTSIWRNHPILTGIRRKTAVGACKGCGAWNGCRGGCPAVVNGKLADPLVQDSDCHKIAETGTALAFPALDHAHPRTYSNLETITRAGHGLRDAVYWLALR